MDTSSYRFGFWDRDVSFETESFIIRSLSDHQQCVDSGLEYYIKDQCWLYEPDPSDFIRVFATHEFVSGQINNREYALFMIISLGFLTGLYLNLEENICPFRMPAKEGVLAPMVYCYKDVFSGLKQVDSYYKNSSMEDANDLLGIIHWFLVAQTYRWEWDQFDAGYKVLDALWSFHYRNERALVPHSKRCVTLSEKLGVHLPRSLADGRPLSLIRNNLIHEAKYGSRSIGWEYQQDIDLNEFFSYLLRLIAVSLGLKSKFLISERYSRMTGFWNFEE